MMCGHIRGRGHTRRRVKETTSGVNRDLMKVVFTKEDVMESEESSVSIPV